MENLVHLLMGFSTSTLHIFIHTLSKAIYVETLLLSLTITLQRFGYFIVPQLATFEWNEFSMQPSRNLYKRNA